MLVLNRKKGETILIGEQIKVTIADIQGDNIKIGIDAPAHIIILRQEVQEAIMAANRQASAVPQDIAASLAAINKIIEK